MKTWFTSDTHLNHFKAIEYSNRPFSSLDDMNESMIQRWNSCVKHSDLVYHLGDFCFGKLDDIKKMRYKLNGKIHLILGNHDYKNNIQRLADCFTEITPLKVIKINKMPITLCHYSMNTWDRSHYNSFSIFGHSHGNWKGTGKSFDVGVDGHNYYPWSYEEVIAKMETLPDNPNYIALEKRRNNQEEN